MLDTIRRRLGLHVHEWEAVDSRQEEVERAIRPGAPGRGSGDFGPPLQHITVEVVTYRCKTCGKKMEAESALR